MKISIVGLGPGGPRYILPAAEEVFRNSEIIIAGKRNMESIDTSGKETMDITDNLPDVVEYIRNNYKTKRIAVAASGDPGFFGILRYMKEKFDDSDLEVVPGISSAQYLFAKINLPWDDAAFASVHGRDDDPVTVVKKNKKSVFLTDNKRTHRHIAKLLTDSGLGDLTMYIGSNLSYGDERIVNGAVKDIALMKDDYSLCVAVVLNEK